LVQCLFFDDREFTFAEACEPERALFSVKGTVASGWNMYPYDAGGIPAEIGRTYFESITISENPDLLNLNKIFPTFVAENGFCIFFAGGQFESEADSAVCQRPAPGVFFVFVTSLG